MDSDCSQEILLEEKLWQTYTVYYKAEASLPTKVLVIKVMIFPVVINGCEIWTIKKAEHRRIDAFELWCWRRLLRDTWTARRSNQYILKEISPENSLEGLMLKLKLQYFGHLMWRTDFQEKTLMLAKILKAGEGDDRGQDGWMASLIQWTWVRTSLGRWLRTGKPGILQSMGSQRGGHDWATELNWWVEGLVIHHPDQNTSEREGRKY